MNIPFVKKFNMNTDLKNICNFFSTANFPLRLIYVRIMYVQWTMTAVLNFFPRIWFPIKKILVYFLTGDVLTKLPMAMSTVKQRNCSFTISGFYCEHLYGFFSIFLEYLWRKTPFFKDSKSLRSKSNNVVLNLFI